MRPLKTTIVKFLLLGLLAGGFFLFKLHATMVWILWLKFVFGLLSGVGLLKLDKVVFAPRYQDKNHPTVITRSFLFLLAFAAVGIWIVTSSGSIVGNGLALAVAGSLLVEMTQLRLDKAAFQKIFFAQINKQYSQRDINRFVFASWVYFALLLGMVFRF